jgi:hypothetical protein
MRRVEEEEEEEEAVQLDDLSVPLEGATGRSVAYIDSDGGFAIEVDVGKPYPFILCS